MTSDSQRWRALFFISIAQLMVVLDSAVMNIALPSAQQALHFSDGSRQWVVTAYGLAFGALLLVGGRIGDMVGRKRVFLWALAGFAIVSAIGGLAVNAPMLLIARAFQGVFAALLAPAALSLISLSFTRPRERAKAFGVFSAVSVAGGAVGLIAGGLLTEYLSWRFSMFVLVPIAVVGILGAIPTVHDTGERHRARLDVPGVLLATVGLVAVVHGFSSAESDGWTGALTIASFVAGVLLLAAFIAAQARVRSPLLPLRVLTERNRAAAYLSVTLAAVGLFGMFLLLSYYFQQVKGWSPVQAGLAFMPLAVAQIVGATQVGARLAHRLSPRPIMVGGYLVTAVGLVLLTRLDGGSGFLEIAVAETVVGLGVGAAFMPAMSVATHGVAPQDAGVASALISSSQQVGGSIGTALLNTVATSSAAAYLVSHGGATVAGSQVHGFSLAYWLATGVVLAAALATAVMVNARSPRHTPAADDAPELVAAH
ncbi:drug resistance transporter, EmrB/QacA subfamily [Asanoa hainanensis]|uniref:Drug resistance transporter, EmrB/QacA subfamily n=1 Tax=Asanoa hainanensis TaxID=560556 RepID=A0A239GQJ0_9ACTN|nr:DHA2 family efflux MFS transporter permease subunit [Asanoa hainanensis]SNS71496.1 drug resistance transporter, EmrB/QacA subfamily [Asanoa hainanensis]